MLWAAGMYSAGIITGAYAWRPVVWWLVGATPLMAAGTYFALRRSGLVWLLGLGTFFLAGALHIQLRSAFQRSGTYHILVVSGMNVSILVLVVFRMLRASGSKKSPRPADGCGLRKLRISHRSRSSSLALYLDVRRLSWHAAPLSRSRNDQRPRSGSARIADRRSAAAFHRKFPPMTFLCELIVSAIGIPMLERTSQQYRQALANWDSKSFAIQLPPRVRGSVSTCR
jgi:hypothetical protein